MKQRKLARRLFIAIALALVFCAVLSAAAFAVESADQGVVVDTYDGLVQALANAGPGDFVTARMPQTYMRIDENITVPAGVNLIFSDQAYVIITARIINYGVVVNKGILNFELGGVFENLGAFTNLNYINNTYTGTIINRGDMANYKAFMNYGGTLVNEGYFLNSVDGADFEGWLFSYGTIINSGSLVNESGFDTFYVFDNRAGGEFINDGLCRNQDNGAFINNGLIQNNDRLWTGGALDNYGVLINAGEFVSYGGTENNYGSIEGDGEFLLYSKISYDVNGGEPEIGGFTYIYRGETVHPDALPKGMIKNAYEFDGWALDGEDFDITKPIFTNITLVAKWRPISRVEYVKVSAYVVKLNGNQNELTIVVSEYYTNGTVLISESVHMINNNAAGVYRASGYKVYVDTKGNTQIRACYIVE